MQLIIDYKFDLKKECGPVIAVAQILLRKKPVDFVYEIDDDLPLMLGDRRKIRQVMLTLLVNAINQTDEGMVAFYVKRLDEQVFIAVIDTGYGIAREDHGMVFAPENPKEIATGLKLSTARALVEAHGGSIWAESQPTHGSAIYVKLPARSPVLMAVRQR